MEEYTSFASVYDEFMDNTPYDAWAARLVRLIAEYGVSRPGKWRTEGEQVRAEAAADTGARSAGRGDSRPDPSAAAESADADERNLVVDLGCGTGKIAERLSDAGFDVFGIDLSEDMLAIAQEREMAAGRGIHYLQQDMRDFELYGCAGTFVSVCDSINYLLTMEDLVRCFTQVRLQLVPGGVFIFDFNTVHKYRDVIGDRTIAEDRDDAAFIWDNEFLEEVPAAELPGEEADSVVADPAEMTGDNIRKPGKQTGSSVEEQRAEAVLKNINVYHVSFFLRAEEQPGTEKDGTEEGADGGLCMDHIGSSAGCAGTEDEEDGALYRRYEELHYQRGYTLEEMKEAAAQAGLAWVTSLDSDTDGKVTEQTERAVVVLRLDAKA